MSNFPDWKDEPSVPVPAPQPFSKEMIMNMVNKDQVLEDLGVLSFRRIVQPEDMNFGNALFGGKLLSWIDEAGALYSMCQMGTKSLVTAEISKVTFKQPVQLGEVVEFYAKNIKVGRSSLTIAMTVYTHDFVNKRKEVTSCEMVFVNMVRDESGTMKPGPHRLFALKSKENERVLAEPVLIDTTNGLPPREDLIVSDMIPDRTSVVDVAPTGKAWSVGAIRTISSVNEGGGAGGKSKYEDALLKVCKEDEGKELEGTEKAIRKCGEIWSELWVDKIDKGGQPDYHSGPIHHVKVVAVIADEPDKNNNVFTKEELADCFIPDDEHEALKVKEHWEPTNDGMCQIDETTVEIPVKSDVKL